MTSSATSSGLAVVPISERVLRKSLGVPVLHCRVHNAGSNRIEADFPFCVLAREANRNASRPPLVSIGIDAEIPAIQCRRKWLSRLQRVLGEHLLHSELGNEDRPFQVCRDKAAKVLGTYSHQLRCSFARARKLTK